MQVCVAADVDGTDLTGGRRLAERVDQEHP